LLLALTVLSTLAAFATAMQPLVLAPALDTALLSHSRPATSLGEVTLNNLGPSLLALFGLAGGSPLRILVSVVVLYVSTVALASALGFASLQLMRRIRTSIANDMQSLLYRHMLSLSMPFFLSQRVGELTNRFVYDAVSTAQTFDPVLRGLFESALQIAFYGFMLFRTDPWLAGAVGAVALLHLGITRLLQREIRQRTEDSFDAYAQVAALVQESIGAIRIVKSFSAEHFQQERLARVLSRVKRAMLRFGFYANTEQPLREVANALAVGTALLVSFYAMSAGRLTLPGFVLFVVVARQAVIPFSNLSAAVVQLHTMMGSSRRLIEILDHEPVVVDGTRQPERLQDRIALEGVSFAYRPGVPVLKDVSLEIPRGNIIAIVGPSGAGKSTLADLVLRLYDPSAGRITYDGVDIREFRQDVYRRHFGVVSQEALLFNATFEENIAYGRPVDQAEIVRAARLANAEEFILHTPDGYGTEVGDRGTRLSGGQRQRIAIARALYGRPEILVLDEATSALDSESEQLVQRAIDRAITGATAIVIAHRLSTVIRAHRIVVLQDAGIVASGTHAELLRASGPYERLYRTQFQVDGSQATA